MVELGVTIYDSLLLAFLVFRAIETKIAVEFLNKTVFLILIVFIIYSMDLNIILGDWNLNYFKNFLNLF